MVGNGVVLEAVSVCVIFRYEILQEEMSSPPVDCENNMIPRSSSESSSRFRFFFFFLSSGTLRADVEGSTAQRVQLTVYGDPVTNEKKTGRSAETRIG